MSPSFTGRAVGSTMPPATATVKVNMTVSPADMSAFISVAVQVSVTAGAAEGVPVSVNVPSV